MAHAKAPITTHVLDQTTGLPASGIKVDLSGDPKAQNLSAITDADGRISNWCFGDKFKAPTADDIELASNYIATTIASQASYDWTLTFWTQEYFDGQGKKSFWKKVQLPFSTEGADARQHWHVPLLLGPFGYTTYRGS